ncbi:DNA polymerase I-like protein with 3'-5' exonuclease and polymerase domains [Rhodoblastus acidophilus]|uniref:DNA polymerase n=1 Tax=Rhodoblastus acidophilus TaxID=1074 RepID=UPI0022242E03|nr:DNA polymerase [Rhodoblastus acidophilus]MCW2286651.1 DNA polymerase I-like protein with 3'-5' exonuclease and polymerase domains [Rhodoblastus acidophilus]MCW2335695.1 DNA polymerase I-like protein with 3'-5' exonuclease and polymerase domains [Rhodoblastus acidophilus]
MQADQVIGHNIIGYDLPLAEKLYPWFSISREKVVDTLILSRLIWPNLAELDARAKKVEGKLTGSHSLKAWGYRLGYNKLEFDEWDEFSEEMLAYNVVDVEVTVRLWILIVSKKVDPRAWELEHQVAFIIAKQERYGFAFDEQGAQQLAARLQSRRLELEEKLQQTFKPFYLADKVVTPKRTTNGTKIPGTWEGAPYTKIRLTVFNPGSRHHIAYMLKRLYNWKPTEFTESGQPKIDETVLGKLEWPEAKLLNEYFLVQKRLGMVVDGENAWLKLVRNGRIYGEVITNGAVTGRATHRNPNVAQTPAVGAPYGAECRALFRPSFGRVQVGIDVSGLELRCLSHFLARWDGGSYGRIVCDGDVHWANTQAALGVTSERDEHNHPEHKLYRDGIKTFIYAFLYGAGGWKIGMTIFDIILKLKARNLVYNNLLKKFFKGNEAPNEDDFKSAGNKLKREFTKKTPGLEKLIEGVKQACERGYLFGLDGRKLHIRSDHAALNTLLQSAGALICKRWMVELDWAITERGWENKCQQVAWVHDELQFEADPDIAEELGKLAVECIVRAGNYFNIKVPLTGEYKIGNNWKECH